MAPPKGFEPLPPRLEGACASGYATAASHLQISDCRLQIGRRDNLQSEICNLQLCWYSWRDSNAHCAGFKPAASAGLGYRSLGTSAWTRTRMSEFKARHATGLHHTRSSPTSPHFALQTHVCGAPTGFRSPYCWLTTSDDSQFTTGACCAATLEHADIGNRIVAAAGARRDA